MIVYAISEFILTISGIAEISWTEKDGDGKESSYSGSEQLLKAVHVLIKPKGSESMMICVGIYTSHISFMVYCR